MLIIRKYESKFLMPMERKLWLPPSIAEKRSVFGHLPIEKRWHVKIVLVDGYIRWKGTFEDRDDCDAFLFAIANGTINYQPELWRLPFPNYFPGYGDEIALFASSILVTSGTSQSTPGDWNNASNSIEGIGGGGSGSVGAKQNGNRCTGGSGAEYRKITNYTPDATLDYVIGSGGTAVIQSSIGVTNGNDGSDTTFESTQLIAKKGLAGVAANGSTPTPPAGGTGGTGGAGNNNGGAGGSTATFNDCCTGGGGAGGPNGAGVAGTANASNNTGTAGGQGDDSVGGTGGAGNTANTAGSISATNGNAGTEFGGTAGSGGAGGGCMNTNGTAPATSTGGTGGNYGAGGGAAVTKNGAGNATSGAGQQGVIYILYTPAVASTNRMFLVMG